MLTIIFNSVLAIVPAVLFVWLHKSNGRWCVLLFMPLCMIAALFMLLAPTLATLLLAIFSFVIRKDTSQKIRIAGAATIAVGLTLLFTVQDVREMAYARSLQKELPVVSVAEQLAYENRSEAVATSMYLHGRAGAIFEHVLPSSLEGQLQQREEKSARERRAYFGRTRALWRLHQKGYADFVAAPGFGVSRVSTVRKAQLELPEAEPVPQPDSEATESEERSFSVIDGEIARSETPEESGSRVSQVADAASAPPAESLAAAHTKGEMGFLDPNRIGYVAEKQKVAGFTSHGFRKPVLVGSKKEPTQWQVTRLQLISLLRFDEPLAYVSDHLPDMVELKEKPETRPLDEFETGALKRLAVDEDVVIEEQPGLIRMLGSLRAGDDCLKCHNVRRSYLLGAFSYQLKPTGKRQ